jgi:hypothetical protein
MNFFVLTAVIGVGKKTKEAEKMKLAAGKAKVTTTGKQPCRLYGDLVTLRGLGSGRLRPCFGVWLDEYSSVGMSSLHSGLLLFLLLE